MKKIKIFLASSIEMESEIILFGNEVGKKNNTATEKDVYFELKTWRDYSARMVKEGSQGLYNESIREGDIFVLLAYTKVGEFTETEFDNAHSSFIENGSPVILTYFKDPKGQPIEESLGRFQEKLMRLRHYFSAYSDFNDLWNKFNVELDRVIHETPSFRLLSNPDHFNRSLTIRVMNALAEINPVARKLIAEMEKRSPAWENEKRFIDQIKESLSNKFIGVVGTEIGRLMAIGKNAYSEEKPADYLSKCQKIASVCIRTITYAFVAKLWNRLPGPLPDDFKMSPAQTKALQDFFDGDEMDSPGYFNLMGILVALYRDIRLEFPIPELEPIAADFATGSSLSTAFSQLNDLSKTTSCSLFQCAKAEDHLSLILEKFIFLTQYEMISIKAKTAAEDALAARLRIEFQNLINRAEIITAAAGCPEEIIKQLDAIAIQLPDGADRKAEIERYREFCGN